MADRAGTTALPRLWYGAIAVGMVASAVALWAAGLPARADWLFIALSIAFGAATFGGFFFIGANLAGVSFEHRVRDETRVRGSSVDHITHIEEFDDAKLDKWLGRYVFARNLFGSLLVPLLIFAGLFLFAG